MRTAAFGKTSGGKRQRFDDDDAPAKAAPAPVAAPLAHPSDAAHSYNVQTTVTDDGSEVPTRLNNKVFIDGLPFNHDPARHGHKTLEELMAQYLNDWKVGKMVNMNKKPGQGFAYVAFRSPNSVEVAVNVLNGRKFLGRPLRVELPRTAKAPQNAFQARHNDINSTVDRQVLITDLAKIAEPEIIRQVLRDAAPQLEAKVEAIKVTSNNRKAFLTLASPDDVDFAVKFLDGYQLLGRTIGAIRAMAPGSLPYSKRAPVAPPTGPATGAPTGYGDETPAAAAPSSYANEDDDDALPLGVAPAKAAAAAAAAAKRPAVAAAPVVSAAAAAAKPLSKADLEQRQVFVGGISEDTTEGMLRQHFANCGIIRSVKVVTNPHTHQSAGVAVVTFAMPSSGAFAIRNLNGSLLNGNLIRVDREDGAAVDSEKILSSAKRTDGQREEKPEEVIDTDAFFKARGIRNPEAYFASVPKGKEEPAAPAAAPAAKKGARVEAAKEAAAVAAAKEEKKAGKKAPAAVEEKAPLSRKEKEEKAKKAAPAAAPIAKNVVSFDYDDEEEVKRPAGGDSDSDEEERFVDVDAPKAAKKGGAAAAKKGGKSAGKAGKGPKGFKGKK